MHKLKTLIWTTREALGLAVLCPILGWIVPYTPDFVHEALPILLYASQFLVLPFFAGWLVVERKWGGVWHALLGGLAVSVINGAYPALFGIVFGTLVMPNPWIVVIGPFVLFAWVLGYMIVGGPVSFAGGLFAARRERRRAAAVMAKSSQA